MAANLVLADFGDGDAVTFAERLLAEPEAAPQAADFATHQAALDACDADREVVRVRRDRDRRFPAHRPYSAASAIRSPSIHWRLPNTPRTRPGTVKSTSRLSQCRPKPVPSTPSASCAGVARICSEAECRRVYRCRGRDGLDERTLPRRRRRDLCRTRRQAANRSIGRGD